MTLVIRTRNKFRGRNREVIKLERIIDRSKTSYPSVKEMQKELLRRFPNRTNVRNRKIKNGLVRIEGNRLDHMTQVITLES